MYTDSILDDSRYTGRNFKNNLEFRRVKKVNYYFKITIYFILNEISDQFNF